MKGIRVDTPIPTALHIRTRYSLFSLPDNGQVPKRCKITELVRMCSAMGMGVSNRIPFRYEAAGSLSPSSGMHTCIHKSWNVSTQSQHPLEAHGTAGTFKQVAHVQDGKKRTNLLLVHVFDVAYLLGVEVPLLPPDCSLVSSLCLAGSKEAFTLSTTTQPSSPINIFLLDSQPLLICGGWLTPTLFTLAGVPTAS